MKKYKYTGKDFVPFTFKGSDYYLTPGEELELPEDSDYVKSLVAQSKLELVTTKKIK